jgi:hypothetical protein
VPARQRRKRAGVSTMSGIAVADAPNRVWAVDFQFDATCSPNQRALTCAPRPSARWPPKNAQQRGPSHHIGPPAFVAPAATI